MYLHYSMKKSILSCIILLTTFFSQAQLTNISGIVNTYFQTDSVFTQNCISYVDVTNATGLTINDPILIIQMQGAIIDTSNTTNFGSIKRLMNAGNFEFSTIKNISGNRLELSTRLINYFNSSDHVQIIKIAKHKSIQITGNITCLPWNGLTGGVVVIEATDTLILNASIDVSSNGFRGGNLYPSEPYNCNDSRPYWSLNTGFRGPKGEGNYSYNTKYEAGINNIATGGGGGSANNSGGGGGANSGFGGNGGNQSEDCGLGNNQGLGGAAIDYNLKTKIFMGGGGGAGQQDENFATPGMNGGGIIIIKANYLIGNGNSLTADGGNQTSNAGNGLITDGAGAGGAGGTIIADINNFVNAVNLSAKGGNGGNTVIEDPIVSTGPGGGGGGGLIWHKGIAIPPFVNTFTNGGLAGIVLNTLSINNGTTFGANDGDIGLVKNNYTYRFNLYNRPEIINSNNDTLVCAKDSVLLHIQYKAEGVINTTWEPISDIANYNTTSAMLAPTTSNSYYIKITDSIGCYDIDTVNINVWNLPVSNLDNEYIIQLYDSIQLFPTVYDSIYWAPNRFIDSINSFQPTFQPPRTQLYRYYLVDTNNCVYYDSLLIKVKQCTDLGLANIFTPNGDGINDYYHLKNILIDELIIFQIFTRWGELIFETKNLSDSWDGTFKGVKLDTDVYTYQIKGICYGALFQDSGNISLVR